MGLDLIPLNFPLGCGPGPDPPQFPPWVWAWRGGVSAGRRGCLLLGGVCSCWVSAWGVYLVLGGVCSGGSAPGGCLLGGCLIGRCTWSQGGGCLLPGTPPCGQTHTCKHITLPQTSFAGGNKIFCYSMVSDQRTQSRI